MVSLEDALRNEYNSLTRGQKQIADYLLSHIGEVHFASSKQLADFAGVSESAVVRFAQRMGYDGFPAMRRALRDEFRERAGHQDLLTTGLKRELSESNIINDSIWRDIELLTHLGDMLDPEVLEDSARRIAWAKSVVAIGHRTSYGFAEYFAGALRQGLGKGTPLSFGTGMAFDTIASMDPDTVVLFIMLSPHSEQTVAMLKAARRRGLYCIVITDRPKGEVSENANATLLIDTDFQAFTSSYIGVVATIHVLLAMIGRYTVEEAREFLERVENQRRDLGQR